MQESDRSQDCSLDQTLCNGCKGIDFDRIQSWHDPVYDLVNGYKTYDLSHVDPESKCRLCTFLFSMRQDDSYLKNLNLHHLRGYSAINRQKNFNPSYLPEEYKFEEIVLLAVIADDAVVSGDKNWSQFERSFALEVKHRTRAAPDDSFPVRDTSREIDWGRIKNWITLCEQRHGPLCNGQMSTPSLTVIDCQARKIVPLPDSRTAYATLSYVVSNCP